MIIIDAIVTNGITGKKPKHKEAGIYSNRNNKNNTSVIIIERIQEIAVVFCQYNVATTVGNNTAKPVNAWRTI